MEDHSPNSLQHQAVGWHDEHHHHAVNAVIGTLKMSIKTFAGVDSMEYSKAQKLLHDVCYYDKKMILATPAPSLQYYFGITSVFAGTGYTFLGHDNLNLTDQGFQLSHHWEIPDGVSVKVEDLFLWESLSGLSGASMGDFETSDKRAVCHRRVVLPSMGDRPVELEELTCIFFANDDGGITTYPTGGCHLVKSEVTKEIAEKLKGLTTRDNRDNRDNRDKTMDVRENSVTNRKGALNTTAEVLDGIKESFSLRQGNTNAFKSDQHATKDVFIGREEELTSRESQVTGREQLVTDREEDLNSREDLVSFRESDLRTTERALEERETYVICYGDELAVRVLQVQSAEYAIKDRSDNVLVREKSLTERENNAFVREESVTQREHRVHTTEDYIKARENKVSAREGSMSQREHDLRAAEDLVKARESNVCSREYWIKERLASIEIIKIALDHRHTALDCNEVDIDNREEAMAAREVFVGERESEIEKVKEDVVKRLEVAASYMEINGQILKSLSSCDNDLAKDRAEFEAEMEKREATLAEREAELVREKLEADGYSFVDTPTEDSEDWEVEGTELHI